MSLVDLVREPVNKTHSVIHYSCNTKTISHSVTFSRSMPVPASSSSAASWRCCDHRGRVYRTADWIRFTSECDLSSTLLQAGADGGLPVENIDSDATRDGVQRSNAPEAIRLHEGPGVECARLCTIRQRRPAILPKCRKI